MADIEPAAFRQLVKELTQLSRSPPEGIRMILNEDTMTDVQAWIRGPEGTPYEGGYFRVKLVLKNEFPRVPPIGLFETKIFHPNVSSQGEICVNTLKKDWQPKLGIRHVLLTIKCLLIAPNPESALNEEAGRQLLERYEDYAKHARMMTYIHARNNSGCQAFESDEDTPTTASTSQRCGESEECTTMDESGEVKYCLWKTL
ncbi:ubiquitin-conjugating enzyme/RWD-like protein [Syncephalis plumigaleata]|nr:ubiquitin-conjugating enzyme/RWD-like protein [Syncephalis plumigaleata]